MKRYIACVWIGLLVAVFTGCGRQEEKNAVLETATVENTEETVKQNGLDEGELETKSLKIAVLFGTSGMKNDSFNQNIYNGVFEYVAQTPGSSVTPMEAPTDNIEDARKLVADIAGAYDVVVCCGYQFEKIAHVAQANKAVKFILVDAFPVDGQGEKIELENVYGMMFAEEEGGFLAGVTAAMETETNKVAVINGIPVPSNVNYQYGFECGVKYVNETKEKEVEVIELPSYSGTDVLGKRVGGNYVGSFGNEATGKKIAKRLIMNQCDVLFVAAGGSGNGAYEAAKETEGVKIVGCGVDCYDKGMSEEKNVVLTSVLKVVDVNVKLQLEKVEDGSFKGGNVVLHMDTGAINYVDEPDRSQLSEETKTVLEQAVESLQNADIVPAANFNGITPESFTTIEKTDG